VRRAAHQLLDDPPVLVDPLAIRIIGSKSADALRADPKRHERGPFSRYLRAFLAARSRFAEDQLARFRWGGGRQYIVLGAGLDTSAYRDPDSSHPLLVWEVDHPSAQAWKRQRLEEAGIAIPAELRFAPVDFERESLDEALSSAGFDGRQPAFFSWLGVTPYLTRDAVMATLKYIAEVTANGGGVVFDYGLSPSRFNVVQRLVFEAVAARVCAVGEPWRTFFEPDKLTADLRGLGLAAADDVSSEALNARFFADRTDGLKVGSLAHLMWAGSAPLGDF
jgi:methyltransferase (TIGR00027 family)